jgi:signal transduction histidine kinase
LALLRYLVEAHGGPVSVESQGEGFGATFTVAIPLRTAPKRCASLSYVRAARRKR